ncbi:uncharacterized protein METZ01_LOCUS320650, partial [marine metagenome]
MTRRRHRIGLKQSIILVLVLFFGTAAKAQNYSLSFDGVDDHVLIPNSNSLQVDETFSISVLIYPTSGGSDSWHGSRPVVTKGSAYNDGVGENINYYVGWKTDGNIVFGFEVSGTGDDKYITASTSVSPNTWSHIVCTYDNADLKVYVNGIIADAANIGPHTPATGNHPVGVAAAARASGNIMSPRFEGKIDNVRIFDTALSASSILNGNETGLVGYWNFNEGTGTTLTDQTSNDNDGTINGATWSTDTPENTLMNPGFETLDGDGNAVGWGAIHAGESQAHT